MMSEYEAFGVSTSGGRAAVDEITGLQIGDRVRFRRPRSTLWREGTVKRWSYSRAGRMLAQVAVDRIGGQLLRKPETARLRPENLLPAT